jgi:hypothetical protein
VLTIIYAKPFHIYITQKKIELLVQVQVWGSLTWQHYCEKDLEALTDLKLNINQGLALISYSG